FSQTRSVVAATFRLRAQHGLRTQTQPEGCGYSPRLVHEAREISGLASNPSQPSRRRVLILAIGLAESGLEIALLPGHNNKGIEYPQAHESHEDGDASIKERPPKKDSQNREIGRIQSELVGDRKSV